MTRDDLDALGEGWDFEAKLAVGADGRGAVPESFWQTYSAMANSRGGRIVLGVRERKDGSFEVAGIPDAERVERDLWNNLRNRQKVSVNLLGPGDVVREEIEGKPVLVVTVPRAGRRQRPVFIHDDLFGGTYLRVHDGDRRCDRERVRLMVADAEHDSRDEKVLHGFGVEDLAADTLRAYREAFRQRQPDHPWAGLPEREFLTRLNAWGRDRETGHEGLTLAGLLMFGRHETVVQALPDFFLDYQERLEDTGALEWSDRLFPDGTWSGNLYDFFRRVVLKLKADLKVPFRLGPDLIRRDETHVHEAVREALVNTLIHADYEGRIAVLVVKRRDGFEFRNPGVPRLPLEEIRQGGRSDCRNRHLQQMFLMLGIGEKAGSGFSRILRAWREQNWQPPVLEEDAALNTTTLRLSMSSLIRPEVLAALDLRFGGAFRELEADARLALAIAYQEGQVSHERLRRVTESHPRDLTLMLQGLIRKGMLERDRPGRGCTYHLPGATASAEQPVLPLGSDMATSPATSMATSTVSSPGQDSPTALAILDTCRAGFRTVREIASATRRNPVTIRAELPGLIRAGRLERRYPDQPRHPRQAYRTAVREGREMKR